MHDDAQKLLSLQAKRKRWQSRLTRAVNMLNKIDRQLVRLGKPKPVKETIARMTAPPGQLTQNQVEAIAAAKKVDDLSIPENLLRPKQKVTDEEKKKMPLSGRAALDAIKAASAKVTAKRERKYDQDITDQNIRPRRKVRSS